MDILFSHCKLGFHCFTLGLKLFELFDGKLIPINNRYVALLLDNSASVDTNIDKNETVMMNCLSKYSSAVVVSN